MKKIAMLLLHLNKKYSWLKYIVTIMLGVVLLLIYLLKERTIDEDQLQYRYGGIAYEVNTDKKFTGKAVGPGRDKSFVNGVMIKEVAYWGNGNISGETIYNLNLTSYRDFSEDGTLLNEESKDINGLRHGYFLNSAKNKQRLIEAYYKHGLLNGRYKEWKENGQPDYELEFKDGLLNGKAKTWGSQGDCSEVFFQQKTFFSVPVSNSKNPKTSVPWMFYYKNIANKDALIKNLISLYNKDKADAIEMFGNQDELDPIMLGMKDDKILTQGGYLYYPFTMITFNKDNHHLSFIECHIMLYLNSKNKIDHTEIVLASYVKEGKIDDLCSDITFLVRKNGVEPSADQNKTAKLNYNVITRMDDYWRHIVSILIKGPNID